MAVIVASRGTGTHNVGATSLTPGGRSATIAAGSVGVLCIAADNAGAAGASLMAPASATDSKGNVWTRRTNRLFDNGAASAGVEMMFYTAPITVALLTTDTLTLTWAGGVSPVAKVWTWYQVTPQAGYTAVYSTGGDIAGAAAANAAVTTSTIPVGAAVIAGYFSEGVAAVTGDSDTTNGTWTAQQTATIGSTTSGVRIATQSKVQTTTPSAQTYNATVASQDRIAGFVVLTEVQNATGTGAGAGSASVAAGAAKETFSATGAGTGAAATAKGNGPPPTPEERAAYVGSQFPAQGITYTFSGITFAVSACIVTGPVVQVTVAAWTGSGGNRVDLPVGNGIFRFVNPPLGAPDGGTEVVTPTRGAPYTRPTYTRNDLLAAQQIVHDAVTAYARTLGWTP